MKDNFIQAKLRTIAWEIASQIALRNCSGQEWFSAVLHLFRTKNFKYDRNIFPLVKKKKKDRLACTQ